jgi:homoserine acetyltransferase
LKSQQEAVTQSINQYSKGQEILSRRVAHGKNQRVKADPRLPNGHYPASHQVAESLDRKRELKNREYHNRCETDDRIDRAGREGDKAVQVS